jgi:hypothetical protein
MLLESEADGVAKLLSDVDAETEALELADELNELEGLALGLNELDAVALADGMPDKANLEPRYRSMIPRSSSFNARPNKINSAIVDCLPVPEVDSSNIAEPIEIP